MKEVVKMKEFLYHYTSADALKSIIQNNSFWISKSEYLNDASEQVVIMGLLKQFFKNNTRIGKHVQNFLTQSLETYINEYNYYILSFSESDDSLPLWNYYSENDGYNIGIEREKVMSLMESYFQQFDEEIQVIITKVDYVDETSNENFLPKINDLLLPFTYFTLEDLENPVKVDNIKDAVLELAKLSFSMKNSAYYSECEERIVIITKKDSELTLHEEFRVFKGAFIPYIVFNKDNEPEYKIPISKIKISPYQSMDLAKESILYMLGKNGYEQIENEDITKSKIPSRY